MRLLLLSDVHISATRPQITARFLRFLRDRAVAADRLYILGDLFDYWLGDDMADALQRQIIEALASLANNGCQVAIMHGNRDFLIGQQFLRDSGALLLGDPTSLPPGSWPGKALLMHGDLLCTMDTEYMGLRRVLRNRDWQRQFLGKSPGQRTAELLELRSAIAGQPDREEYIMDVHVPEVHRQMLAHGAALLIHGHTHRPALHHFELNGNRVERAVLGDWRENQPARCLCIDNGQLSTLDYFD